MLLQIQPVRSAKPVLALVHGQMGIIAYDRGRRLARHMGAEQPIYGLESRGFDCTSTPAASVEEAAREYLAELADAGVSAPGVIASVCEGYVFALEMARQLAAASGRAPLLLLIDPPGYPPGSASEDQITPAVVSHYRDHARTWMKEAVERLGALPFDETDPRQLDWAAETAMKVLLSICRYVTLPYPGPVHIIATGDRAEQIGRPQWPWRKRILAGPWTLTKLDCAHGDLFADYAGVVFDWMKSKMETAPTV
jgi:thioesterase domain-containing protein